MEICVYEWCNCTVQQLLNSVWRAKQGVIEEEASQCVRGSLCDLRRNYQALTAVVSYKTSNLTITGIAMEVECFENDLLVPMSTNMQVCHRIFAVAVGLRPFYLHLMSSQILLKEFSWKGQKKKLGLHGVGPASWCSLKFTTLVPGLFAGNAAWNDTKTQYYGKTQTVPRTTTPFRGEFEL